MRKNSIFTILAVILPLTVANADEITSLTLDTPVNWSVSAFNRSIGQYCWGGGYHNVSNEIIGDFGGYVPNSDRVANLDDLSDECNLFGMNYATKFKRNSAISLRDVIDMCMSTINSGTLCANIAKSLVFYSLGQKGAIIAESQIDGLYNEKVYSANGMFYVYSQVSYAKINNDFVDEYDFYYRLNMDYSKQKNQDASIASRYQTVENRYARVTAPQMVDPQIYLSETNEPVGRCEPNRNIVPGSGYFGAVDCTMRKGAYENWSCSFAVGMNALGGIDARDVEIAAVELRCKNNFIDYQQKLSDNMSSAEERFRQSVADEANRLRTDFKSEKQSQTFGDKIKNMGGNIVGGVYTIKVAECIKQAGNAKIDNVFSELREIVNPDQKYSEELWQRIRYAGWRIGMPFDDARYNGATLDDEIHAIVYQCKINNQ